MKHRLDTCIAWLRQTIPKLLPDCLAIAGAAAITYGAYQWQPQAGWACGGAFLLGAAYLLAGGGDGPC